MAVQPEQPAKAADILLRLEAFTLIQRRCTQNKSSPLFGALGIPGSRAHNRIGRQFPQNPGPVVSVFPATY